MFDGIPFEKLTAPVLLGITVLMILLGLLIPRYMYKEKARECENYRLAYETEREARIALNRQTIELFEVVKTTHSIVVAMFEASGRVRQSGESRWSSEDEPERVKKTRPWRLSRMLERASERSEQESQK